MENIAQLKWQIEMGADEAIASEPFNRLIEIVPRNYSSTQDNNINQNTGAFVEDRNIVEANNKVVLPKSPFEAVKLAKEIAESCDSLQKLEEAVRSFDGLSIKKTAANTVFASGSGNSKIMFIGEAPDGSDDIEGTPFSGISGDLLRKSLSYTGLNIDEACFTNAVYWRPPGNRLATDDEIVVCSAFLKKHIELLSPELIVMLGNTPYKSLKGEKVTVAKFRGNFFEYIPDNSSVAIKVIMSFNPSYLLKNPLHKKLFWRDLLHIKKFLYN